MTETGDHVEGGPVVMLPKGDPVYSIYTWRQDSITLERLRPVIEEMTVLADAPCQRIGLYTSGRTCLEIPAGEVEVCLACRLKQLRARLYGYRQQPPKEGSA